MDKFDEVVALAKRRGFVYQGSEIYGGLANTYDYGPLGALLLRNIKNSWWDYFVTKRDNIYGLDTSILMSPKVWEASGHVANFAEALIDCKECKFRTRADHLIEDYFSDKGEEVKVEGKSLEELEGLIGKAKIPCPKCGKLNWTKPRLFNNLFETHIGIVSGEKDLAYLRGEIAQGMFVNFKNVLDSVSPKMPFGLAQTGAAFRNEITPGKFIFRTLQFNLSEFEYFFNPEKDKWEDIFEFWKEEMWMWVTKVLQIEPENLRWRMHTEDERSHYSTRTEDVEYKFPFGYKELYGLAYRTDFDLKNHTEKSKVDLRFLDSETGEKYIPHVVEPTFGMDRTLLVLLMDKLKVVENNGVKRTVLALPAKLAPYTVAVFPLLANKPELVEKARKVYKLLQNRFSVVFDSRGNIGKRYFAQDEIGTPWCVTVDFQTLEDDTVTVRDRDSAKQERVEVDKLTSYFQNNIT
jgi:glycyl-tRNA synthetase